MEMMYLAVLNDCEQSGSGLTNENIGPSSNQGNDLISHDLLASHSLNSSTNELARPSLNSDSNGFYCKECDRSFGNNHGLLIHNGRYHKKHEVAQRIDNDHSVTAVKSTKSKADYDTTTSTRRRRLTCPPNLMNKGKIDNEGSIVCCLPFFPTMPEYVQVESCTQWLHFQCLLHEILMACSEGEMLKLMVVLVKNALLCQTEGVEAEEEEVGFMTGAMGVFLIHFGSMCLVLI
ncbi:unnamed protein product [Rodentolepis nana]|uniref:C2H2-type domain-containing protein n=1 Tax=Rodentolepis nana TaxID=102285 RepID=A0A158QHJ4_RODNA|nr:unnamed protein product [Rodentolepis nana]